MDMTLTITSTNVIPTNIIELKYALYQLRTYYLQLSRRSNPNIRLYNSY